MTRVTLTLTLNDEWDADALRHDTKGPHGLQELLAIFNDQEENGNPATIAIEEVGR